MIPGDSEMGGRREEWRDYIESKRKTVESKKKRISKAKDSEEIAKRATKSDNLNKEWRSGL